MGEGGGGFRDVQKKVDLKRKWVETEVEGKSSCEKLRVVLAVLLVVAVCQHTPSEIQTHAKGRIFGPPEYIPTPHSVGPPRVGAYRTPDQPPEVATTCNGSIAE